MPYWRKMRGHNKTRGMEWGKKLKELHRSRYSTSFACVPGLFSQSKYLIDFILRRRKQFGFFFFTKENSPCFMVNQSSCDMWTGLDYLIQEFTQVSAASLVLLDYYNRDDTHILYYKITLTWCPQSIICRFIILLQIMTEKKNQRGYDWCTPVRVPRCLLMIFLFLLPGGPSAARFAGNQLVNLLSLLNDHNEPTVLKMVGNQ